MFTVRQRVHARLSGVFRVAIVEQIDDHGGADDVKYYVHWIEQDRRLDAWLSADDLRHLPTTGRGGSGATMAAPKTSGIATRSMASREGAGMPEPTTKVMEAPFKPPEPSRQQDSKFFSRAKNVRWFVIGEHQVESWYFTPYALANPVIRAAVDECGANCSMSASAELRVSSSPATPLSGPLRVSEMSLYICPYCLAPFQSMDALVERHLAPHVCARHPPGAEVYRDVSQGVIIFEADGAVHRAYAERVALLSKAFLEHKSLDYDTTPFVFYTLCFLGPAGCSVAGYFSREKRNPERFNLSCILTLPQHQGRGLGRLLVEMSYEMSRREGRVGSPEKPLSDLGEKTYMSYWRESVVDALLPLSALEGRRVQLDQIMSFTGMTQQDVTAALRSLKLLDSKSPTDAVMLHLTPDVIASHLEAKARRAQRGDVRFEPCLLAWKPWDYELAVVTRYDLHKAISAVPAVDSSVAALGDKRTRPTK